MSRLKKLMSDFIRLKEDIRKTESEEKKNRLIGYLMAVRGQHRECNKQLIHKRQYASDWRQKNRAEVSRYNREYARMRRQKIEVHTLWFKSKEKVEGQNNERIRKIPFFKENERRAS